ncbi:unnamed protein product [Caenorhabditis angaria]|uniref:Immunoglobulin-binding protein 1 n=1 Tax=Caenorhabditis angaria TaxID=860376 RepID=A0A9P1ILC2_9PELO|nr:unnamed protein product [Caenorhabditis angaria]
MNTAEDEENVELVALFEPAENLVQQMEDGNLTTIEIQPKLKENMTKLEELTILVNKLGMYSSNELIEDVQTQSLRFLLIPCYLGVFQQNLIAEPKLKLEALRKSQIYYRNFLERLRDLTVILDWESSTSREEEEEEKSSKKPMKLTPEETRRLKLERHRRKKELKKNEENIRYLQKTQRIDEDQLRELYIIQLQYWAEKAFEEIQSIEDEIPILKMMVERPLPPPEKEKSQSSRKPMKPFVITRDQTQKQVFGLGYPSIPTLTVDEWYNQRFGHEGGGGPAAASAMANQIAGGSGEGDHHGHSHEPGEACSSDEEDDDAIRAKGMQWDEYKDDHRRGWGNTHNKG